ncbi:MAG: N-carbamoyl-L-amino acid amidohydrolase [Thermoanaerobaculia bacterium]
MAKQKESPYLSDATRLGDVIAAIQAMATYKFYKLDFNKWADRITGDVTTADHWKRVFEEHPEFFRLDSPKDRASLVWRRQHPKRFDVDSEKVISIADYQGLSESARDRISRVPLGSAEISTLVKAAINLHSRALDQSKEKRWWIPLLAGFIGFVGAVLGAYLKA